MSKLLDVSGLTVRFPHLDAVSDLSFSIASGETVAIVGESGSGKSLTALALMGLLPPSAQIVSGSVRLAERELTGLSEYEMAELRGNDLAMIFQEPMTSLNPMMSIGWQIAEVVRRHRGLSVRAAWKRAVEMLGLVGIPDAGRRASDYPHQLSGGQRQRVMIAMAIALQPKLLIADEPTTALDATIQAQILALLDDLRRDMQMGLLLITHDLGLVGRWSDRVVVMHHGEKLEEFQTRDIGSSDRHAYTRGLTQASVTLADSLHYSATTLAEIRAIRPVEGGAWRYDLQPPQPRPEASPRPAGQPPLLEVRDLSVDYNSRSGRKRAVDCASFFLAPGETLGIVGESGSGKSTLSKAIMRLVPSSGQVLFMGRDLTSLPARFLRPQRRHMQMVFQDPFGSLNPRKSIGQILEAPLAVHGIADQDQRRRRIAETLDRVGLPANAVQRYPHEFSGGQRQRIGIARALILQPSLLICDEPVSALDVSIQAQILNLLVELKQTLGLSYLFISHDLAVVQYVSDRVIVMKDARIVEQSDRLTIWRSPKTAYTRELIAAARGNDGLPARAHCGARDAIPSISTRRRTMSKDTAISRLSGPAALEAVKAGALLVDVRSEAGRHNDGEIHGAVVIPKSDVVEALTKRIGRAVPDQKLVIFCTSTKGSEPIVEKLEAAGVSNVYDVDGGFSALTGEHGLLRVARPAAAPVAA